MDYNLYSAEDFASDESFINYFLKKDNDDFEFWENWKIHHPHKLDEIYNAEQLLGLLFLSLPESEVESEFNRFENYLSQSNGFNKINSAGTAKNRLNIMVSICCGLLIFMGCLIYLTSTNAAKFRNQQIVTRHNPFGQRSIFQLNDGTKVTLNANSTLKFPEQFGEENRNVELEGEAFFEVTKDKSKPFNVKSENLTTTVLGTKFNINTHDIKETIKISLVEGKVKVTDNNSKVAITLNPAQSISYQKNNHLITKASFNTKEIISWKDGILSFKNASFDEVSQKIYTTFGIRLIDPDGKLNWDYTGEFNNSDYLSIIKSICYAKKLKYKIVNDTIIIKK
ncbi:hypothetical protein A5893_04470 [Pedobacter psychrophilus]|uniref:Uncharacterized protein n=1 Tax=Pedobacter psychrophilus TaxID=1826909 RepID=A0A179DNR2_9SPHI|nr:FecR family protein [Pedobacter psychrophilus]OAQ42370.1 hypothetical protein A5893_04470 [Pedobacter psychrophilus]